MIMLMILHPCSTQGVNDLQGGQSEIVHTLTTCERIPCYLVCSWPPPLTPVTCKHIHVVTNTAHILLQVTIYRSLRIGRECHLDYKNLKLNFSNIITFKLCIIKLDTKGKRNTGVVCSLLIYIWNMHNETEIHSSLLLLKINWDIGY